MRRRVAVPVAVYTVTYEVRSGRPYSGFERMVLKAVVAGTTRLADLENTFAVQRRVLVEAIVTLVHAGWVALGGGPGDLLPTAAGASAIADDRTPATVSIRRPPSARILMEQVHGELVPGWAASYRVLATANQADVVILPRHLHRAALDPGEVQYLLPHGTGEWVSWIDPEVTLMTSGLHHVVAEVDTERGVIHNLPAAFVDSLEPILAERLGVGVVLRREELREAPPEAPTHTRSAWYTPVGRDDLTVGPSEHVAALERALDSVSSRIVIASAFLGDRAITRLTPKISGALLRGADVDLIWGYEGDGPPSATLARLQAAAETARSLRGEGVLTVNEHPSGSHMKLLAWDQMGTWHTTIGSFNWLSAHSNIEEVDLSITLECDGLTASVLRHLADVWRANEPVPSGASSPRAWLAIASLLEANQITSPVDADARRVSLVYGRSHEIELRNALRQSVHRLVITSHHLGPAGVARLKAGEGRDRAESFRGIIMAGDLLEGVSPDAAADAVREAGCQLLRRGVHAKVLVRDDTVLIGSYNYLSADVLGRGSRAKELSVRIEDPTLPALIFERLRGLPPR